MFEPTDADRLLIQARLAVAADRIQDARAALERVIALEPVNPMALTLLAELAVGRRDNAEALRHLSQVLAVEPNFAPALFQSARALWSAGRHTEALEASRKAQSIQPGNLEYRVQRAQLAAWMGYRAEARAMLDPLRDDAELTTAQQAHVASMLGEVAIIEGRSDEATRWLEQALRLDPTLVVTRMQLGLDQLRQGAFTPGWANYAARESVRHYYPDGPPRLPGAVWTGQALSGRSIVVIDDQGHGDSIHFFRFLPRLQALGASQVTLVTFPGLERLYRQAAPALTVCSALPAGTSADFHCNSTAMLRWLGVGLDTLPAGKPYLFPPAAPRLRPPRRRGPQVGLAWSGDPAHTRDHLRSIPAELFLGALAAVPGLTFHSLQRDVRPADRPALQRRRRISRAVEAAEDFADTASLIAGMDLVVSVDTSVAHLAAAMGKPVWLVLHAVSDWRWLTDREDSPWYPTMRLFRLRGDEWGDGDLGWRPLLARVAAALRLVR